MKSVLISIQPKWCELIASGKKTVEVRKTKPKLETPFKVYIYCTKKDNVGLLSEFPLLVLNKRVCNGKVIGEFVCNTIHNIKLEEDFETGSSSWECGYYADEDCLSMEEFEAYLKKGFGYGWHISDLVIYDKPRELSEFYNFCNGLCFDNSIKYKCIRFNTDNPYACCDHIKPLTRPPQSWCYVEVQG